MPFGSVSNFLVFSIILHGDGTSYMYVRVYIYIYIYIYCFGGINRTFL